MFDEKRKREILELLKDARARKVFLQVPEGLRISVQDLIGFLEDKGFEIFLSIEQCFGACDLREHEARLVGCDHMLHIGHSDFGLKTRIPVIYYPYEMGIDPVPLLRQHIKHLRGFRKVSLSTTVQFAGSLPKAKRYLEGQGLSVFIGRSGKMLPGQILGCNWSAATSLESKIDAHVFIGSGRFHPLGLQYRSKKPVIGIDVETGEMIKYEKFRDKMEIMKAMRIEKAKGMKNFAILMSSKPGQLHTGNIRGIKRKLNSLGKNAYVMVADRLTPEKMLGLKIDVIVNTACPRIPEDGRMYGKTVIDAEDVLSM